MNIFHIYVNRFFAFCVKLRLWLTCLNVLFYNVNYTHP